MLFQDYLGTYVFHCHILPHEDAGMMQVITIVENTDSSWNIAAEGFKAKQNSVTLYQAQDFKSVELKTAELTDQTWERAQSDLNNDRSDIAMSSSGSDAGMVFYDEVRGIGRGCILYSYSQSDGMDPLRTSGDGKEIFCYRFDKRQDFNNLQLDDLELKALAPNNASQWNEQLILIHLIASITKPMIILSLLRI